MNDKNIRQFKAEDVTFTVSGVFIQNLINYLGPKPYNDVGHLMEYIRKLRVIEKPKQEMETIDVPLEASKQ